MRWFHSRSINFVVALLLHNVYLWNSTRTTTTTTHAYQFRQTPFHRPRTMDSQRSYKLLQDQEEEPASFSLSSLSFPLRDLLFQMVQQRRSPIPNIKSMTGIKDKTQQKKKKKSIAVDNVDLLRTAILDEQREFKTVNVQNYNLEEQEDDLAVSSSSILQNHQVLELLAKRFETNSKPGKRQDNATLALAMEGGGMRGCVSAGMAAAIASLGLTDCFDSIYGSSAGSVIGAYMISRQMCVDVYVDILPAAQRKFVCKRRLIKSIATSLADMVRTTWNTNHTTISASSSSTTTTSTTSTSSSVSQKAPPLPGMNISYVLDGIMDVNHGLRPLDMDRFWENNQHQPLRIVSSAVDRRGNLFSRVFGTRDFMGKTAVQEANDDTNNNAYTSNKRSGLFACLQASMTVPGATGPPVKIQDPWGRVLPCFDAFCFEPIPYRSAVEEGATHVLALCSRPDGFHIKTKPGVYEQGVAPLYFYSHGQPVVAEYFEKGGQQYIYAEDILTLEKGKVSPRDKVLVPPPRVLYGVEQSETIRQAIQNRQEEWKKAYLLPLKVPASTLELSTLEQDYHAVLEAVRGGYAAAFDILAPIVGLNNLELNGEQVAELVFPNEQQQGEDETTSKSSHSNKKTVDTNHLLTTRIHVPGFDIVQGTASKRKNRRKTKSLRAKLRNRWESIGRRRKRVDPEPNEEEKKVEEETTEYLPDQYFAHTLLANLPGFNGERGAFDHLSKGLRYKINSIEVTL